MKKIKILVIGGNGELVNNPSIKLTNTKTNDVYIYNLAKRKSLDKLQLGEYIVELDVEGYQKQSRKVNITATGCIEYFYLGTEEDRIIGKKYKRPIKLLDNYIGIVITGTSKVKDEIEKWLIESELTKHDVVAGIETTGFIVYSFKSTTSSEEKDTIFKYLFIRPEVVKVGGIVINKESALSLLTNKVSVDFKQKSLENDRLTFIEQLNPFSFKNEVSNKKRYYLEFDVFPSSKILDYCDNIANSPMVESVLPILFSWPTTFSLNLPTDVLYPLNWHLDVINAPLAWEKLNNHNTPGYTAGSDITFGSSSIKIAVNDTGVESSNGSALSQDLNGTLLKNENGIDVSINKISEFYDFINLLPNNNNVNNFHGTAVAAICAGNKTNNSQDYISGIVGVAPNAQILASIFTDYIDELKYFKWLAGFTDVDYNPEILSHGAEIITTSMGPSPSFNLNEFEEYHKQIRFVTKYGREGLGTIVLFAAGNSIPRKTIDIKNPFASIPEVITVGASSLFKDNNGVLVERISTYSCYGDDIDIVAPSNDDYEHWRLDNDKHQAYIHQPDNHFSIIAPVFQGEGYMPGVLDNDGVSPIFCLIAETYTPQSSVSGSYDTSIIVVEDNGTGIDIENTFVAGKSVLIGDITSNPTKMEGRLIKDINPNSTNSNWWDIELETEYKVPLVVVIN